MKASDKMSVSSWIDLMSGMAPLFSSLWNFHSKKIKF